MPIGRGTRLGPYEITALLGAGGMGEVYRATDSRLGRIVAIKILSPQFAENSEFRERFQREAKTLSHLSHPNVCTLHDLGNEGGTSFLVMEHLEGETLASRLGRNRTKGSGLPLSEVLAIAEDVASALEAAHRLGIVHRDLKPGNVMLTKTGAKLMDFGLAKREVEPVPAGDNSEIPTQTIPPPPVDAPLTTSGAVLGTFQYMAPEQVEGQPADARTDVFAFGALIHEMVSGQRAFQGRTQLSIMGAILKDDPVALQAIQPSTPAALDFLVRKCLAKSPEERWQSIHDVKSHLKWIAERFSSDASGPVSKATIKTFRTREFLAWSVAAGGLALALVVGVTDRLSLSPAQRPDVRFEIAGSLSSFSTPAVSPDGGTVAFVAKAPDSSRDLLWIRQLSSTSARPLPGTEDAVEPFWSPDGRSIGFGARAKVKRVDTATGTVRTICDLPAPYNFTGAWGSDDTIVFSSGVVLLRAAADGGPAATIATLDITRGETSFWYPTFLHGSRHFLYTIQSTDPQHAGIYAQSLEEPGRTRISDVVSKAVHGPPGYLIYESSGSLVAQPFDAEALRLSGSPAAIVQRDTTGASLQPMFTVSASGALVYRMVQLAEPSQLQWFNRDGRPLETVGTPGFFWGLALSPDEKRLAVSRRDPELGRSDVWAIELATGIPTRVTFDPSNDDDAAWTADGAALTFWSDRAGKFGIFKRSLGGAADVTLYESATPTYLGGWSRDGKWLLYHDGKAIFELSLAAASKSRRLLESKYATDEPHISPDGEWVAYNSAESGSVEVYVASFPTFEKRRQVSLGGGGVPWWRSDGEELFYMSSDAKIMSVPVQRGVDTAFGIPRALFQTPIRSPLMITAEYVVADNGRRFLVAVPARTAASPINVVLDWTRLLRQ